MSTTNQKAFYDVLKNGTVTQIKHKFPRKPDTKQYEHSF